MLNLYRYFHNYGYRALWKGGVARGTGGGIQFGVTLVIYEFLKEMGLLLGAPYDKIDRHSIKLEEHENHKCKDCHYYTLTRYSIDQVAAWIEHKISIFFKNDKNYQIFNLTKITIIKITIYAITSIKINKFQLFKKKFRTKNKYPDHGLTMTGAAAVRNLESAAHDSVDLLFSK